MYLYGRLWHQFIVGMFSKVEQRRKHYYRTHQRQLRVDVYSGMTDTLQQDLGVNTMIWQGIKAAVLFFHFLTQAVHGMFDFKPSNS